MTKQIPEAPDVHPGLRLRARCASIAHTGERHASALACLVQHPADRRGVVSAIAARREENFRRANGTFGEALIQQEVDSPTAAQLQTQNNDECGMNGMN
jgi:hypothetical protein